MSLSIGIVGLPNIGKSTLFNALLKRQVALAANYPFATIEPNVGIVDLPDENLNKLVKIIQNDYAKPNATPEEIAALPEKIIPATIQFYDIAGLVKGASEGEGLGNKFLSHIREVDAIVHLVRNFDDSNVVREGSVNPESDAEIINTELILSDMSTLDNRLQKHQQALKKDRSKDNLRKDELYKFLLSAFDEGKMASELHLSDEDKFLLKDLNLLTIKPMIYVLNVNESDLSTISDRVGEFKGKKAIQLSAQIESELSSLGDEDQALYMADLGIKESGLDIVIQVGYELLGLQTFYTAGPKEVRAWTIRKDLKAPKAAAEIHTDFEKGFVKAMVITLDDLVAAGSYKAAKEQGKIRMEGKEYEMRVGDVVEFMINA